MKRSIKFILFLLIAASLSSCEQDGVQTSANGRIAIAVNAGIRTRAVDNQWEDGDAIGITMFTKTTNQLAEGNYMNCRYSTTAGAIGNFLPSSLEETIYFPKDGSEVDFLAYSPYRKNFKATEKLPLTLAVQTSQSELDFMTAEHLEGTTKETPNVKLRFYHRLTKLIFNLKTEIGDDAVRLIGSKITVTGMPLSGDFHPENKTVTADAATVGDLTIAGDTQTGTKAEATVFPRPSAKGVGFQIELTDGSIYSVKMSDTLNLNGGYKYTFNITLKKTPTTVSADIQPWGEGAISGLSALAISTPAENSRNITIGDTMRVYADDKYLVTYTFQTDGSWKSSQPVYWENIGVGKSTIPFRAMTILAAPLHSTQMPDLLISTSKENNRNTGVSFELKRVAAKVKVQLASSDHSLSEQELNRAEITLPDYTTGGTIDNGLFQAGAVKATITTDRGEALLQPQTITIGTTAIVVTIDGNTYKGIASTEIKYNAGEITHLNVNIIKTEIQMSAVITPWSDGADMDLTGKLLNVKTSGSTTDFVAGDKIKVEILQNLPKNASYEYNGTAWITNAPLWWDDLIRPTEIAATMPDTVIISNQKNIHWSIPANQNTATGWKNVDLLTAYIASLPAGDAANFTFRHAMSRVKVVIQPGTEFTAADLQNRTILLNGMPQSATVNIIDGSSSELSGNQNIKPKETSPLNYEALVIPHGAVAVGTEIITLTLGTDTYPVKLTAPLTFVSGQLHTITVKLSKTNITLSATVEPWGNGQGGTIEIK